MNNNCNNEVNIYDQLDACGKGKKTVTKFKVCSLGDWINIQMTLTGIGGVRDMKIGDKYVRFCFRV